MVSHPFLQQIDHIGIQAEDPRTLFEFFTGVLGLPVAFPYTEYPFYSSGSVVLGNSFLEIMRFGAPGNSPRGRGERYHILGFLNRPNTIQNCLIELDRRNVPHSVVIPFFAPEATDENPTVIWSNVYLGRLLGENLWMRLFFAMTKQSSPKPSQMRSRMLTQISVGLMARAFRNGMPVLTEYAMHQTDEKRAADWEKLRQCEDGNLGIECVQEVIVGLPARSRYRDTWARFLAPQSINAEGSFGLEPGPAIRLVEDMQPRIQTFVLRVSSLAKAEAFAQKAGLSCLRRADRVVLELPGTNGLVVELATISAGRNGS